MNFSGSALLKLKKHPVCSCEMRRVRKILISADRNLWLPAEGTVSDDEGFSRVWYSRETDGDEAVLVTNYLFSHKKGFEINHHTMTYVLQEHCPTITKLTAKVHIELAECVCR